MLEIISALHMSTALPTNNMDSTSEADAVNNSLTSVKMCSIELQLNSSFRLQCSLSSLESESDLSLAFERELGEEKPTHCDGLPAFEIRAYSPHGRTPSPIDDVHYYDTETPNQSVQQQQRSPGCQNNPEFVALHEINAQISALSDNADESITNTNGMSHANSLETIFEGVFLQTPPREKLNNSSGSGSNSNSTNRNTPKRVRANLMELVAINRLHINSSNKENQSPDKKQQHELT